MDRSESESKGNAANWWMLPLGDAIAATPVLMTVQAAFGESWQAAGQPAGMSLWLCTDSAGLHCRQTLFLSPGCRLLALQFGATPCPAPLRSRVQWFAGALTVADAAGVDGK